MLNGQAPVVKSAKYTSYPRQFALTRPRNAEPERTAYHLAAPIHHCAGHEAWRRGRAEPHVEYLDQAAVFQFGPGCHAPQRVLCEPEERPDRLRLARSIDRWFRIGLPKDGRARCRWIGRR